MIDITITAMIVIIFNNSCGPFLLTVEDTHGCLLSVVWFSEGLYWPNQGYFHNVLLEGKFCRFDSIGIRLYRNGICREKKPIASLLSRLLLLGSSYFIHQDAVIYYFPPRLYEKHLS